MSSIQITHAATGAAPEGRGLPASLVLLLAMGAGLSAASLYYAQPMLGVLGADIGASPRSVGLVPTLTQLGYALGILLLAPLGDRFDRRRIVLAKAAALCAALLVAGAAPSIGVLLAASLAIGLAATMAQDIVPAAALPRWKGAPCSITASVDQKALNPTASSAWASAARRSAPWRDHSVPSEPSSAA